MTKGHPMDVDQAQRLHDAGLMSEHELDKIKAVGAVDALGEALHLGPHDEPEPDQEPEEPEWFASGEHPLHPEVAGQPAPA